MKSWSKQQQQLLGLSSKELLVLDKLSETQPLNTVEVSGLTKIPRITVRRLLLGLNKRGFVRQKRLGNSVCWSLENPSQLKERVIYTFDLSPLSTSHIGLS